MVYEAFLSLLIALQFAAFGWRINREIAVGDEGRLTWFPISDYLNLLSMITLVIFCIILPMIITINSNILEMIISISFILLIMHPVNTASHYRLFSKKGRYKYIELGKDFPWITDQEIVTIIITLTLSIILGVLVYIY